MSASNPRMAEELVPKPVSEKKKRVRLLDPIIGNDKNKPTMPLKKNLAGSKLDIAIHFLDILMQPQVFINADAIKITFKAEHIIQLCNVAE